MTCRSWCVADCQGRRLPPRFFIFLNGFGGNGTGKTSAGVVVQGVVYFHGGRSEWVDLRWDTENNHKKKKKLKMRILGGEGVISLVGAWLFLLLLKL